jgi:hypothetical protein
MSTLRLLNHYQMGRRFLQKFSLGRARGGAITQPKWRNERPGEIFRRTNPGAS